MALPDDILIKADAKLKAHIQRQLGATGQFSTASDYVQHLIRRDLEDQIELRSWYDEHLKPAVEADEAEFIAVTADEVIRRNQRQ